MAEPTPQTFRTGDSWGEQNRAIVNKTPQCLGTSLFFKYLFKRNKGGLLIIVK